MIVIQQITNPSAQLAFPLLNQLRLGDEEFAALTRQGFIRSEQRGGRKICRLRFRVEGRQHVRYVSPRDAAALEAELEELQRRVRGRRRLMRTAAVARQALQWRRRVLAPLLEAYGYHFHGNQIRRSRRAARDGTVFLHPPTTKERVMEPQRIDLHAMGDQELNRALERCEELDELSIQHQRRARIQEYEELALARSNPLAAVLGMGTCYFAQIFEYFGKAVCDELESQPPTLTAARGVSPEIRLLLNVRSAMETDLEFDEHVRGEQPMALSGPTKHGTLKEAVHRQHRVASHRPRSNN